MASVMGLGQRAHIAVIRPAKPMMKSMSKPRRVSNESSLSFGFISSVIKRAGGRASARPPALVTKNQSMETTLIVGSAAQPALQPVACSDLSAQCEIIVDLCVVRTYSLVAREVCDQIERIDY